MGSRWDCWEPRSQQHLQGLRKQVLSPLGWFPTDHGHFISEKFSFLSFPRLRHTIKTSLFEESLAEDASPVLVPRWRVASCSAARSREGVLGCGGLLAPSRGFSLTGRGAAPVPQWEEGNLNPGPWAVSTWEPGKRTSLGSGDISGSSSSSGLCA